jgi:uncharacterized protein YraI
MRKHLLFIVIVLSATACNATPTAVTRTPQPATYSVATATSQQATLPESQESSPERSSTVTQVILTALTGLRVRACPGTICAVIGGLQEGDQAQATGTNAAGDWYQIAYLSGSGWVYGDNVAVLGSIMNLETVVLPSQPSAPHPTSNSSVAVPAATRAPGVTRPPATAVPVKTSAGAACPGLSLNCSQLTCQQAYACLAAGNRSLDGDGDGTPCESICG